MKVLLRILFVMAFASAATEAAVISGRVTDEKNHGIPFASVYVKGTTRGTTANMEGNYTIELAPGKYEIVFKFIGYKSLVKEINVGQEKIILDVQLNPESIELKEAVISSDSEDPAYAVIRQAIKKRKFYLNQVNAFSCDVYIKGVERMTKFPKKFLGEEINAGGEIDTSSGIVYLSESVSKFNFKQPDKIKEEMVSSKVSGSNHSFSYNQASDMLFNFYENVIEIDDLSERGFISPISNNALLTYRYKLLGTFFENGEMVNKIKVIPRRKNDPAFSGVIYIMENTWRIHSTELILTKDAQIDFVDTLLINQIHVPVDKDVWMPFTNRYVYYFGFMGFAGNGMYVGVNSNYILEPDFPKRFFSGEVMKIVENANKKDSIYWEENRPVPLTSEEALDYHKRDSLARIHNSKAYQDSMRKKYNKFELQNVLTGYTYYFHKAKFSLEYLSLLDKVQFNTVQGLSPGIGFKYTKWMKKFRYLSTQAIGGYGIANKESYGTLKMDFVYHSIRAAKIECEVGKLFSQFNEDKPIAPLLNTAYSLMNKRNYMKLFRKEFLKINHTSEIYNGVTLNESVEYASRSATPNFSNFSFFSKPYAYSSNNPLDANDDTTLFRNSDIFKLRLDAVLIIKQKYYTRPHQKIVLGSKYPTFTVSYQKAIPGVYRSSIDYDLCILKVEDELNLKLFGRFTFAAVGGYFLRTNAMQFMDYRHFMGNQTLLANSDFSSFYLLPYYSHSTNTNFAALHAQHNFGGFIFNKIPLLKKLKLEEIVKANYLLSGNLQYMELAFGIQRMVARVDFVTGYSIPGKVTNGLRIGLLID